MWRYELTLQFLRVHFQQRENPFTPAALFRTYASYAVVSSLAKMASSVIGAFCPTAALPACLFVLAVDYLMVTMWYLWLFGQATQARARFGLISLGVSALFAVMLAVAVLGALWKSWDVALEVIVSFRDKFQLLTVLDTNDSNSDLGFASPAH